MSWLKILSDEACQFYCDYEHVTQIEANTLFRFELNKGEYILGFKLGENEDIVINKEYNMPSSNEEAILKIHFQELIEQEQTYAEILETKELPHIVECNNDTVITITNTETKDVIYTLPSLGITHCKSTEIDHFGLTPINIGGSPDDVLGYFIEGGKWGCIDKKGRFVIPCMYDAMIRFEGNLTVARQGNDFFYINILNQRKLIEYTPKDEFLFDLSIATNEQQYYGGINTIGEIVIPFQYENIIRTKSGCIWAKQYSKWGIINHTNAILHPFVYDEIAELSERPFKHPRFFDRYISVRIESHWGIHNNKGEVVVKPKLYTPIHYLNLDSYNKIRTIVRKGECLGVINCDLSKADRLYDPFEFKEVVPCEFHELYDNYGNEIAKDNDGEYLCKGNDWPIFVKYENNLWHCCRYNKEGVLEAEFLCSKFRNNILYLEDKMSLITHSEHGYTVHPYIYDYVEYESYFYQNHIHYKEIPLCHFHLCKNGKWGLWNEAGVEIIPFLSDSKIDLNKYYKGICAIDINSKKYFFKLSEGLLPNQFNDIIFILDDHKYVWLVCNAEKWKILDQHLNPLTNEEFDFVDYGCSKEHIIVGKLAQEELHYALFDIKTQKTSEYMYAIPPKGRYHVVFAPNTLNKKGIYDTVKRKIVLNHYYEFVEELGNLPYDYPGRVQLFIINENGLYAIIEEEKLLCNPIFTQIRQSPEKRLVFEIDNTRSNEVGIFELYKMPFFEFEKSVFNNINLFIDVETTGLAKNETRGFSEPSNWPHIVQLAYIIYDDDRKQVLVTNDLIIKPTDYIIPESSTKIHGISHEEASRDGVSIDFAIMQIDFLLSKVQKIVGHNVDFDLNTIKSEILRIKKREDVLFHNNTPRIIDTMKQCGNLFSKWPKLTELHQKLFGTSFSGEHNALADVQATFRCFNELVKQGVKPKDNASLPKADDLPF